VITELVENDEWMQKKISVKGMEIPNNKRSRRGGEVDHNLVKTGTRLLK